MIRYWLWLLAATLLSMSLCLIACTGNPGGSNANSASTKPVESAQNRNNSTASPGQSPIGYEGFQDDINCYNLIGWAWDGQRPNDPVKVEIYDGNTLLATVTADLFRQDLVDARKGNGNHSFNYTLPAQLRDGKPHTLRAKIAGTDMDLAHTLKSITCKNE
ncbi:MAG: hypothetical protein ACJ74J_22000 [Blastocatellia bacterium]